MDLKKCCNHPYLFPAAATVRLKFVRDCFSACMLLDIAERILEHSNLIQMSSLYCRKLLNFQTACMKAMPWLSLQESWCCSRRWWGSWRRGGTGFWSFPRWPKCWTCWRTSWRMKVTNMSGLMEESLATWDRKLLTASMVSLLFTLFLTLQTAASACFLS